MRSYPRRIDVSCTRGGGGKTAARIARRSCSPNFVGNRNVWSFACHSRGQQRHRVASALRSLAGGDHLTLRKEREKISVAPLTVAILGLVLHPIGEFAF